MQGQRNLSLLTRIQQALPVWDVPDPKYVWGFDTSFYSGLIDWPTAYAAGVRFAIIKALDGESEDPLFEKNYAGAKAVGMLVGAYQWLYKATASQSDGGQARKFLSLLADFPCDLPPVVDFEWASTAAQNPDAGDLNGWIVPMQAGGFAKPMVYTAPGYAAQYVPTQSVGALPLWLAQYRNSPTVPAPWTQWKFWQWSANVQGTVYGFPTSGEQAIDFDYWCGTLADLLAFCGKTNVPPVVVAPTDPTPLPPAPDAILSVTMTILRASGKVDTNVVTP